MDKKIDLIAKLFITYIFILALCFLVYSLVVLPTNGAEKVNAIIGLLGWSATIFAPIAAIFLLDNWKDQKAYELRKEYISFLLHDLRSVFSKILIISTTTSNIKRLDSHLVIKNEYLNYKDLEIGSLVINLFGNIKVISKIDNNSSLLELYDDFELHVFFIDYVYKNMIKRYINYYNQFTRDRNREQADDLDIFREYIGSEKSSLNNHIFFMRKFIEYKHQYWKKLDASSTPCELEYTLEELLKNTLDIHNKIQDILLKSFKP